MITYEQKFEELDKIERTCSRYIVHRQFLTQLLERVDFPVVIPPGYYFNPQEVTEMIDRIRNKISAQMVESVHR